MPQELRAYLNDQQVSELDLAKGVRASTETTISQAVQVMQENRTGCLLVCEEEKLLGIFTERDYIRRVLNGPNAMEKSLMDCSTRDPVTVKTSDSVATLVQRMHEGRFRQMPVVDPEGLLVGCVSIRNVLHHIAEHYPNAVYNVAPVSKPKQSTREGA